MNLNRHVITTLALTALTLGNTADAQSALRPALEPPNVKIEAPAVIAPPESFFKMIEERMASGGRRGRRRRAQEQAETPKAPDERVAKEVAICRSFYKKYIDVKGLPVAAHADVSDLALQRTYDIVTHMLAGRPDILQAMVSNHTYLIVIGKNQVYTDMPEYRDSPNPAFQNERVRGTGGNPTSFGEENLLCLPIDRYDDESIGVHEFCHTIDGTLQSIDPGWGERLNSVYRHAMDNGLWRYAYAASNPGEYWAETCQAYFDCGRPNNWNHGPVSRREQLRAYDPMCYELCRSVFNLSPEQDWRYAWLQPLPMVSAPPTTPMFKNLDPWYTKFTWAREFTVVGRGASDEALLQANETIRRMFAYRHDILKALMAEGLKLVVLGPNERLADLPEYKKLTDKSKLDHTLRYLTYYPEMKLLVVAQENVLADPHDNYVGDNQVIRVFADALYRVAGMRPVIADYRGDQQYELRVKRLDLDFDRALAALYDKAKAAKKWKGTSALEDKFAYWTAGVLVYFNALGQDAPPHDAPYAINTRERLKEYDADLFTLVNETMAYEGHVDWRYSAHR
ncbi:MAG: hypothetical protein NT154_11075 [Verrucomicrobia bacterium]|nr:hypothetical protein [Verrucomicrobiota bacterium]